MAAFESSCELDCDFADDLVSYNSEIFSETIRHFKLTHAGELVVEQDIGDVGECVYGTKYTLIKTYC